MKTPTRRSGFSIIDLVIVVGVVGLISFLGYLFYNNQVNKTASNEQQESSQSTTASDVHSAPAINSVADLDAAETALNETDPANSNDINQLDTELANF